MASGVESDRRPQGIQWRTSGFGEPLLAGTHRRCDLGEQLAHALADVVADPAHAVEVGVGRVVDLPVLVALARRSGTRPRSPS